MAQQLATAGSTYQGRSSPHWYDVPAFHELLYASGDLPVRDLIAHLDGCGGAKADEIVAQARLSRAVCKDVDQRQAARLLEIAQETTEPVHSKQLGRLGPGTFPAYLGERDFGLFAIWSASAALPAAA